MNIVKFVIGCKHRVAYALEFAKQDREMKRYEEILGEMRG